MRFLEDIQSNEEADRSMRNPSDQIVFPFTEDNKESEELFGEKIIE